MDNEKTPQYLYAVRDLTTGELIWNARGGTYRTLREVCHKIERLTRANPGRPYELVTWVLYLTYPIETIDICKHVKGE